MTGGVYLERFLFVFLGTLWVLYLAGVSPSIVGGVGALLLVGGVGYKSAHSRRAFPNRSR